MSYHVLARKWRPKTFHEMVGQEHVLKALVNALDQGRLHHAYLFTGTRGVGKTTIARILAKSLNCETGVGSEPCGQCSACQEINEGRFVDLIEVDAASRTKVEDTRELLDNVQYAPTRGRYKVYLIDEVHMLSGHSFNALLKTLEEPPEHVKFLLATTDPQKLPITILSRCLQFSLKAMTPERIVGHLKQVLEAEAVSFEEPALWQLGRAADGSMRDAMSLTDQAIAYGNGQVLEADVRTMLGSIDREHVFHLVDALAQGDASALLQAVAVIAEQSPDFSGVLADLISALHRMAVAQLAPDAVDDSEGDGQRILECARQFAAEQLQLFYQTALLGRRDLALAPDVRSGFEMTLLRMLLFKPQGIMAAASVAAGSPSSAGKSVSPASTAGQSNLGTMSTQALGRGGQSHLSQLKASLENQPVSSNVAPAAPIAPAANDGGPAKTTVSVSSLPGAGLQGVGAASAQTTVSPLRENHQQKQPIPVTHVIEKPASTVPKPITPDSKVKSARKVIKLGDVWADMIEDMSLEGPARNLARNSALEVEDEDQWTLSISPRFEALYREQHKDSLEQAASLHQHRPIHINVVIQEPTRPTPDQLLARHKEKRKQEAIEIMQSDPFVKELQSQFGATLDIHSVSPVDDEIN